MEDGATGWEDGGRRLKAAVAGLVALGLALRLIRYLQNFPMWCDETMLAANLLDRPWSDLARPLDYRQVCPQGFLALEWVAVRRLGFSEATLRLVPLLAGLASVPLFARLARLVLGAGTVGAVVAVGLFAVSQPPIRYAAEFKPYATDLLVAVALLLLVQRWRGSPGRPAGLWAVAASAPFCVALSLPSLFVLAAVAVVGLAEVAAVRSRGPAFAYAGFVAASLAGVGVMAALGQYHTSPADRAYFLDFWATSFPPSGLDPLALGGWLVRVHTGALFAYPHGPIGNLAWLNVPVLAAFLTGAAVRWRRDPRGLALLLLPFAFAMAAAALRRYPYGASARVAQFLVPSTLLPVAAGVGWVLGRVRPADAGRRAVPGLLALLVVFGAWRLGVDLVSPYRTPWDRTAREFARWFWEEVGAESELVCVQKDLGIPFRPEVWSYDGVDEYLCYQRIYSPRHRRGLPPRWDSVSFARPLRCVLLNRAPGEVPGFVAWVAANRHRFALRDVRTYTASRGSPDEPRQIYVVCEFLPVPPTAPAVAAVGLETK